MFFLFFFLLTLLHIFFNCAHSVDQKSHALETCVSSKTQGDLQTSICISKIAAIYQKRFSGDFAPFVSCCLLKVVFM